MLCNKIFRQPPRQALQRALAGCSLGDLSALGGTVPNHLRVLPENLLLRISEFGHWGLFRNWKLIIRNSFTK